MAALDFYNGVYEREAVDKAVALREEITPVLIEHLKMLLDDYGKYEADDHYAHIYAFMLLGHFRETRAHDAIMDIISLPEHVVDNFFGDMITQDFHWIMYATCGGRIDRIKQLVLNRNAYEYCRGAGMQAIVYAVADGVLNRAAALEFFSSLFEGDHAEPGSHFWNEAASSICDLYPSELMPIIEKAYENGLIWPGCISHKEFLRTLAAGKEITLEEAKTKLAEVLSQDIHSRISWWASFREDEPQATSRTSDTKVKLNKKNTEVGDGKDVYEPYSDQGFAEMLTRAGAKFDVFGVYGLFYGVLSAPELTMPSQYINVIFGDDGLASKEEATSGISSILFLLDALAKWDPEKEPLYYPDIAYPETKEALKQRATDSLSLINGVISGLDLGNTGESDFTLAGLKAMDALAKLQAMLTAFVESFGEDQSEQEFDYPGALELMEKMEGMVAGGVKEINLGLKYSRIRAAKAMQGAFAKKAGQAKSEKIGRNEPCPCGSGRKHKKCCGLLH